ncbi:hypothetical protein C0J52_18806 [Blattella germanica]|nr:hypothetical protein C0J52_18806 [Blattella germanica]
MGNSSQFLKLTQLERIPLTDDFNNFLENILILAVCVPPHELVNVFGEEPAFHGVRLSQKPVQFRPIAFDRVSASTGGRVDEIVLMVNNHMDVVCPVQACIHWPPIRINCHPW